MPRRAPAESRPGATADRDGKPLILSLVEDLERNWPLSMAVIVALIVIASAL